MVEIVDEAILPVTVADAVLGDLLLEIELGHADLFGGRAVGGEIFDTLLGQGTEFLAEGRLAVEVYLDDCAVGRILAELRAYACAIGATFILTERSDIAHVEDVLDGIERDGVLCRVLQISGVDVADRALGRLHLDRRDFLHVSLYDVLVTVGPGGCLLALLQRAEVLLDKRLEGLGIDVADKDGGDAGRIVEQALVDTLQGLDIGLGEDLGIDL